MLGTITCSCDSWLCEVAVNGKNWFKTVCFFFLHFKRPADVCLIKIARIQKNPHWFQSFQTDKSLAGINSFYPFLQLYFLISECLKWIYSFCAKDLAINANTYSAHTIWVFALYVTASCLLVYMFLEYTASRKDTSSSQPVVFPVSLPVSSQPPGCRSGYVLGASSPLKPQKNYDNLHIQILISDDADLLDISVPGCSSLGCAFGLPVAACCPTSPFLPCLEALSDSCRALLSAFSSALLFAGLSAAAGVSEAGTGTRAGTAEGAEGDGLR